MAKRFMKSSVLFLVVVFIATTGFSNKKLENKNSSMLYSINNVGTAYVISEIEYNMNFQLTVPYFGKSYLGFCEDLGFSESSGNYKAVNRLGYVGKYQFGRSALRWVGVKNKRQFLNSPVLQESAFKALIAKNKWVLRDYILKHDGKTINGIPVTESGIIAAAHLGGAKNVKRFLDSNGESIFADANNVPITTYMKKFAHYDLSSLPADRNAKVTL